MYRDNVESLSDRLLLTLLGSNIYNNPPIYRRTQHWSWYDEPGRPPALDQAQQRAEQPLPARYQPQVVASHLTIITSYDWAQTDWTRRITYYLLYYYYYYAEFSDFLHKWSLFEMEKYYGSGFFKIIEPDFKLGSKLRDVREATITNCTQSSTLTGHYGLHVVIDTVQLWHGPLVVDCLLSDATISLLSSVVTIVSLDTGPHPPLYLLLSNILHCICPACWGCVLHIDTEICEVDRLDIDSSVSPVLGPHPLGVSTYPPHFVGFTSFQLRIQNANELMTFITTDWFAYNWNGNWKPHDCFHFFFNFQENKCWGRLTADWLPGPGSRHIPHTIVSLCSNLSSGPCQQ